MKSQILLVIICLTVIDASANAAGNAPAALARKVDFKRDVAPILQSHCVDCHGPNLVLGSLRLDEKKLAFEGEVIEPGKSGESLLIRRLFTDKTLGIRMPPTGPSLQDEQIGILKAWIDQGASWPDGIRLAASPAPDSGDARLAPVFNAIRQADAGQLHRLLRPPEIIRASRADGMTPLIFAVQFSTPAIVEQLLKRGADPNAATSDGLTALMAGAASFEKTRLLLRHGADPKAKTVSHLTVLEIAAAEPGNTKTLKLLLDRGVKLEPSALAAAAAGGDPSDLEFLIKRGADVNGDKAEALKAAAYVGELQAVSRLLAAGAKFQGTNHPWIVPQAAICGHLEITKLLVESGADVNFPDDGDRYTPLMAAADSDFLPVELVRLLIRSGADPNYQSPTNGETPLSLARKRGRTPVVEALEAAGAKAGPLAAASEERPSRSSGFAGANQTTAGEVRAASQKSLGLLQSCSPRFFKKTGCMSCHHQLVTSMAIGLAREKGIPVDEAIASRQTKTAQVVLEANRAGYLLGRAIPGGQDAASYILAGLADEGFPPNEATDTIAVYLLRQQSGDGSWRALAHRPPSEYSPITTTSYNVYAIQAYAPPALRQEAREKISRALDWLLKCRPTSVQEHATRLLGLKWSGANRAQLLSEARALAALQQADGGWAQLATLPTDAYATALALVALNRGGGMAPDQDIYRRGLTFLLRTQQPDGSWFVKSRAHGFQPYFQSGFPYEHDQWISAHATGLSTMALMTALPSVAPNPGLLARLSAKPRTLPFSPISPGTK